MVTGQGCALAGCASPCSKTAALAVEAATGLHLTVTIGAPDLLFVLTLIGLGSLLGLIPALVSYRMPVSIALRG